MKIYLRKITLDDGKYIVKWRNDLKVRNHCFNKTEITIDSNRRFYETKVLTGQYKQYMVIRVDDEYGAVSYPIATVYLKDFDENNKKCELCIFTSNDLEWNTESQIIAIKELLRIAFTEYNIMKVYSYVIRNNSDEIELLLRAGFFVEARLEKEAIDINGKFVNVYRMAILKNDYTSLIAS